MARHDQKAKPTTYTCTKCREYECDACVDEIRRKLFGDDITPTCVCKHADYKEVEQVRAEDHSN